MTELVCVLEGLPPTLNHRTQPNGRGGRYVTPAAQAWAHGAILAIRAAASTAGAAYQSRAPLAVDLAFIAPDCYRWDVDNRCKSALDALAAALGLDDRYITTLTATKARGPLATTTIRLVEVPPC